MYYKLIFEDFDKIEDEELYDEIQKNNNLRMKIFLDDISSFSYIKAFKNEYSVVIELEHDIKTLDLNTTVGYTYQACNMQGEAIKEIKEVEASNFLASFIKSKKINISNITNLGVVFDCPICKKGEYKNTIFYDSFYIHAYANSCKDTIHRKHYLEITKELRRLAPKEAKKEAEKELGEKSKWISIKINQGGTITKTIDTSLLADHINTIEKFAHIKTGVTSDVSRFIYRDGYYKMISDDEMKAYIQEYIPIEMRKTKDLIEVMNLIYINLDYKTWDDINPKRYINFKNGLLDLNTKELISHTPLIISTIQIPSFYNKEATTKNGWWDKYLNTLTSDEAIKRILHQFIGLTISNHEGYRTKKAIFLVGKHDSGKTQIQEMLGNLLGHRNIAKLNLAQLESRFGPYEVLNKRFIGSGDLPYMKIAELNIFKQLTGGDSIYLEGKGKQGFTYKYTGTMLFGMNRLPKFGGDIDSKIYERMLVIPCNNVIAKDDQEPELQKYLEEDYEYIIKKAVDELYCLIENKYRYTYSETCNIQSKAYEAENNTAYEFVKDCCTEGDIDTNKRLKVSSLYKTYKIWNEFCNNSRNCLKLKEFKQVLEKLELGAVKLNNGYPYLQNITLNNEGLEHLPYSENLGVK